MRSLLVGKSLSSEHACITSVVQDVARSRERVLVKDEETLEDLEDLFVKYCEVDTVVQLLIRK